VEGSISTAGLTVGTHTVYVRMKDSEGNWGVRKAATFVIQPPANRYIATCEYFIDTDPGRGNGTTLSAADGVYDAKSEQVWGAVTTQGLAMGNHTLFVRMKDFEGNWGPKRGISFRIGETTESPSHHISAAEFFVDQDPGNGNGTAMIAKDGAFDATLEEIEGTLNTDNLSIGDHLVYVRIRDSQGKWSDLESQNSLITILSTVKNKENSAFPNEFMLFQNYPNPFNAITKICFDLPKKATVKVTIHDINGRLIAVLLNEEKLPGSYDLVWQPEDLASGEYFCRLQAEKFVQVRKIVFIK